METDLTGHFLIAMPAMQDPRFAHAVVFICAHSEDGTMGLIINKPAPHITFANLLDQLGISGQVPDAPVYFGGPVEMTRGFVLHSDDYKGDEATATVGGGVALSTSQQALSDLAAGHGPRSALFALGYAGWEGGQLERELQENAWLTAQGHPDLLFDTPDTHRWEAAMGYLGIDPVMLSSEAGRA